MFNRSVFELAGTKDSVVQSIHQVQRLTSRKCERTYAYGKEPCIIRFFMQHAEKLTETWYESIEDDDPESIYRSTDSSIIAELKRQNQDYYQHFIRALIEDKTYLHTKFKNGLKT